MKTYGNGGIALLSTLDLGDGNLESTIVGSSATSGSRCGGGDGRGDTLSLGDTSGRDEGSDSGGELHFVKVVRTLSMVGLKLGRKANVFHERRCGKQEG